MRRGRKLALGGVMTSICTILNVFAGIIPAFAYIFPALAGLIVLIIFLETDDKLGFRVYISSVILSFMLCVDKTTGLNFLLIFGLYPILKYKIENLKFNKFLAFITKCIIFNILIFSNFWVEIKVFSIPEEVFNFLGIYSKFILLAVANLIFLMYDRSINKYVLIYYAVFRPKLSKLLKNMT